MRANVSESEYSGEWFFLFLQFIFKMFSIIFLIFHRNYMKTKKKNIKRRNCEKNFFIQFLNNKYLLNDNDNEFLPFLFLNNFCKYLIYLSNVCNFSIKHLLITWFLYWRYDGATYKLYASIYTMNCVFDINKLTIWVEYPMQL